MSPYFLVYGSKAILQADISFRAPRVEIYDEEQAVAVWTEDIDRAEEERLITCIHTAKYPRKLGKILQPQHQRAFICCRRPRSLQKAENRWDAQALLPLGRALRGQRGYPTRVVPAM